MEKLFSVFHQRECISIHFGGTNNFFINVKSIFFFTRGVNRNWSGWNLQCLHSHQFITLTIWYDETEWCRIIHIELKDNTFIIHTVLVKTESNYIRNYEFVSKQIGQPKTILWESHFFVLPMRDCAWPTKKTIWMKIIWKTHRNDKFDEIFSNKYRTKIQTNPCINEELVTGNHYRAQFFSPFVKINENLLFRSKKRF